MSYNTLIKDILGMSHEEITAGWDRPEEIDEVLANERTKLERSIVENNVKQAAKGDIAAVNWLEERHWIILRGTPG